MSTGFIDFVFEGSNFSPKRLKMLTGLMIVSLAEAGETGKRGRYKGKPKPYGLGYLEVEPRSTEANTQALERVIDDLTSKKPQLKESGVDDITLDLESVSTSDVLGNISKSLIKKISLLGAGVEVSTIADTAGNPDFSVSNSGKLKIDQKQVKQASSKLKALENPIREKLINAIQSAGEIDVRQLTIKVKEEQSVVSQHLAILRWARIVSMRKQGRFYYYSVNRKRVSEISRFARFLAQEKPAKEVY